MARFIRPISDEERAADLTWHRANLQSLADEFGETWLLMNGYHPKRTGQSSSESFLMHGISKKSATAEQIAQRVEEVRPRSGAST